MNRNRSLSSVHFFSQPHHTLSERRPIAEARLPPLSVSIHLNPCSWPFPSVTGGERKKVPGEPLCLLWGSRTSGLFLPSKRGGSARVGRTLLSQSLSSPPASRPLTSAQVSSGLVSTLVSVFIESGADANFIDQDFAENIHVETVPLPQPFQVSSLNNYKLLNRVSLKTAPITLTIENHTKKITFLVIQSPDHSLVLGIMWLETHNLQPTPRLEVWKSGSLGRSWVGEPHVWLRVCIQLLY